ncbi:hypothetical protein ACJMK2_008087 [Sinanodonta woodiana]|uniref:Uncharacterized protein n=1 Tax=Sinanodonta woodiana TaxID=1069815 RepID=A0ABD3VNG9_SINWO
MDITFRFTTMLVFIVLSSLIMHLGRVIKPKYSHNRRQPSMPDAPQSYTDMTVKDETDDNSDSNEESSSSPKNDDLCYTETGKLGLTLSVALILVAFCVGAAVMAVILCCTQEKWRRHISSQSTHHASKSAAERSDHGNVTLGIHVQTSDSVYTDPGDNEDLSANNVPVNRGAEHLELIVQCEPNDYESLHEHINRSTLEHPYGCVFAGSDVNPITHNDMENNEAKRLEGEHGYFVLSGNEADGENGTEGSEMKMVDENHDYCVLASVERDGENLTEGNKIRKGEKNHDYCVFTSNESNG